MTGSAAVNGSVVGSQLPFDSAVPVNAVRFFTDGLNEASSVEDTFAAFGGDWSTSAV